MRQRGIATAAVFATIVRGQARPDSDVDVLVDVDPAIQFNLLDLVGVRICSRIGWHEPPMSSFGSYSIGAKAESVF